MVERVSRDWLARPRFVLLLLCVSPVFLFSCCVQCWMCGSQYAGYLIIVVGRERSGFVAAESITLQAARPERTCSALCASPHAPGAGALEALLKTLSFFFRWYFIYTPLCDVVFRRAR